MKYTNTHKLDEIYKALRGILNIITSESIDNLDDSIKNELTYLFSEATKRIKEVKIKETKRVKNLRTIETRLRKKEGNMKAEEIKEIRENLNVSQEKFAKILGTTTTINRWENNKASPSRLYVKELKEVRNNIGYYLHRQEQLENA